MGLHHIILKSFSLKNLIDLLSLEKTKPNPNKTCTLLILTAK